MAPPRTNGVKSSRNGAAEEETQKKESVEEGTIKSVRIENFLCHPNLQVELIPRINVISGQNGSGKSAVLAAILTCFGATAKQTNRADAGRSLVRDGAKYAIISVTLRNRLDPYKENVYGESITVERKVLRESSGGGYKIKDHAGRIVSSKKEELIAILDHFDIQVENPCVIMMQDTAKNFLHAGKPEDKYKFFFMATELDKIQENLLKSEAQIAQAEEIMKRKEEVFPAMEQEVQDLEREMEAVKRIGSVEKELETLVLKKAWATVAAKERDAEKSRKALQKAHDSLAPHQKRLADRKTKVEEIREQKVLKDKELEECTEQLTALRGKEDDFKNRVKEAVGRRNKIHARRDDVQKKQKDASGNVAACQKRLDEMKAKNERDFKAQHDHREDEIRGKVQQVEALKRECDELSERLAIAEQGARQRQFDVNKAKEYEEQIDKELESKKKDLRSLEATKADRVKRFGERMPDLLNRISTSRNFKKKPIGPIGAYVSLTDSSWAVAVEEAIGNTLTSFICNDFHDSEELRKLIKAVGIWGVVPIVQEFSDVPYDVTASLPDQRLFRPVYSVISISDPNVHNCLVDQANIENVCLFETFAEAAQAVHFPDNQRPRGVSTAFLRDGLNLFYRGGVSSSKGGGKRNRPLVLGADVDEQIRAYKEEIDQLQPRLRQAGDRIKEAERAMGQKRGEPAKIGDHLARLKKELRKLESELSDLQNPPEEQVLDTSDTELELEQLRKRVEEYDKELEKINIDLADADAKVKKIQMEKKHEVDEGRSLVDRSSELTEALQEMAGALHEAEREVAQTESQMKKIEGDIAKYQQEYDTIRKQTEDLAGQAEARGPRVEMAPEDTPDNVAKQFEACRREVEQAKRRHSRPLEQIEKEHYVKEKRLEAQKAEFELTAVLIQMMHRGLEKKKNKFVTMRRHVSTNTAQAFNIYLSQRGDAGTLEIDHGKRTLNTPVSIGNRRGNATTHNTTDTRQLSGGERSYTTVALLLALHQNVNCPFRCLDEFDVFMDAVNRKLATDLILDSARRSSKQYILLTPQDITIVENETDIKVQMLQDPTRQSQKATPDDDDDEEPDGNGMDDE